MHFSAAAKSRHPRPSQQYVELLNPIPSQGTLVTSAEVVDIQDKGGKAVVVVRTLTKDDATGEGAAGRGAGVLAAGA